MYRSILVPLDGSALAERALTVAATLAAGFQSELHLVHVFHGSVTEALPTYGVTGDAARSAAEHYVLSTADRLRATRGGRVSGAVLEGSSASSIIEHATTGDTDLIVMSSHGRTGASRLWLGSVADAIIRSAPIPVLMIRGPGDLGSTSIERLFERVLVPLDGSLLAEAVVPHALAVAKLGAAHVHLLQIEERAEDLRMSVWGLAAHEPDDLPARLERADHYLHTLMARLAPELAPATASVEARGGRRTGEVIAEVAVERASDLIAMATRGRGASRLLIGSVADKVIRGTECSILLYRPR